MLVHASPRTPRLPPQQGHTGSQGQSQWWCQHKCHLKPLETQNSHSKYEHWTMYRSRAGGKVWSFQADRHMNIQPLQNNASNNLIQRTKQIAQNFHLFYNGWNTSCTNLSKISLLVTNHGVSVVLLTPCKDPTVRTGDPKPSHLPSPGTLSCWHD